MKGAIFCQGSREIGLGHIIRCLAFAGEFRRLGFDVEFLINDNVICIKRIEEQNFEYRIASNANIHHILSQTKPDFVLTDSNEASRTDILEMVNISPVINIAAQGDSKWYADASFIHSCYFDSDKPKDSRGKLWCGPEYVPLRKEFARLHKQVRNTDSVQKIIVAMGGGDVMGHTTLAIQALKQIEEFGFEVIVVVGAAYEDYDSLQNELRMFPHRYVICRAIEHVASLMMACDVGILSMGTMIYEACCLGLPSINICPSRFHANLASIYEKEGMLISLGFSSRDIIKRVKTAIKFLINNDIQRKSIAQEAKKRVDGLGISRITSHLIKASKSNWNFE